MEGEKLMAVDLGVPVKVPVPAVGTEEQVIGKDRWEFIHRLSVKELRLWANASLTGEGHTGRLLAIRRWLA